ncbi:hypothetical protein CSA80_04225 [Candidatus Saccharibacteria bacterium]|nr:MAG: hypothetical protein CR973_01700 [Candidatus Saccharibacteria bacterium]PID98878.1 MAG: hypothetical protein CSA80_04225 [Candidatus Saccharibacteria bacterium]
MKKKTPKTSLTKIIIAAIIPLGITSGSFFGYQAYQKHLENKIYSISEVVSFPDFDFKVTKAEFKPVNLPIDQKTVAKYGALDKQENCDNFSKEKRYNLLGGGLGWSKYGPSDYNICIRRNNSRNEINRYSSENKQLVVDYSITAKNNVNTSKLTVWLEADSGRNLASQVDAFNANQFFEGGTQELIEPIGDAPGAWYPDELPQKYIPLFKSDLGGDINKGITRKGYAYTDIRNAENSVDIKIIYKKDGKGQSRIIRLNK